MHKQGDMNPEDLRNLFIFLICSLALYFVFDHFVARPNAEALRQQQKMQAELADVEVPGGTKTGEVRPRKEVLGETARLELKNDKVFGSLTLKERAHRRYRLFQTFRDTGKEKECCFALAKKYRFSALC